MAVFCVLFALKTINQRRCNGHSSAIFKIKKRFYIHDQFLSTSYTEKRKDKPSRLLKKKRITNLQFLLEICTNKLFCTDEKACLQPPGWARLKISDMRFFFISFSSTSYIPIWKLCVKFSKDNATILSIISFYFFFVIFCLLNYLVYFLHPTHFAFFISVFYTLHQMSLC